MEQNIFPGLKKEVSSQCWQQPVTRPSHTKSDKPRPFTRAYFFRPNISYYPTQVKFSHDIQFDNKFDIDISMDCSYVSRV